ncbi:hypothetical protein AB0K00_01250 [Dactylosporangium sp. NPDC049525]|uniref:type II secretion system F family protein n=1 Tax=Dactylosporangium sp. NPDC049525 TaxID=3154730 RepID=UPI00342B4029
MNAIDLALAVGGATTVGFGLLLVRRRGARTRLDRLSRHRRTTAARRRWPTTDRLSVVLVDRPGVAVTAGSAVAGGAGMLAGGPVAATLAAAYVAVALVGVRHHLLRRAADRAVAELLDAIEDAVGDLRAGVVPYATAAPYPGGADVELYTAPAPPHPSGGRLGQGGLGATVRRIWEAADEGAHRTASGRAVNGAAVNGAVGGGAVSGAVGGAVNGRTVAGRRVADRGRAAVGERSSGRGRAAGRGEAAGRGRAVGDGAEDGRRIGSAARARPVRAGRRRREDAAVAVALARLEAAHRVSEALGTPLADLLDQVEADLRAGHALRLNLAAQTSGAQTTTTLLVGLPAAGLWLGAGIGVDPVGQLLHTPLGAACAITAVALQCAGLLWTGRMVRSVVSEVR